MVPHVATTKIFRQVKKKAESFTITSLVVVQGEGLLALASYSTREVVMQTRFFIR